MCGICFIIGGAPITSHNFTHFNFFGSYLRKNNISLSEHIIENKLILPISFQPKKVKEAIEKRGPDHIEVSTIDMFKIVSETISISTLDESCVPTEDLAFSFQSILHLRGKEMYISKQPASHFLYNGEIWDTGNLQPLENNQNDAEWFHNRLLDCKGSRERISEMLQQIRGDYAFIFLEGDDIFIGKDYFGKRSLMVGMGENYFVISSVPIHNSPRIIQPETDEVVDEENPQEESWRQKYEAEWLSSKNKYYFEIPSNCLINITKSKTGEFSWYGENIFKNNLSEIPKCVTSIPEEEIIVNVKKLLIESLKEMTRCIYELGETKENKVAVLFSGGIDSTLIARLLDFILPKNESIDLINLAFRADAPDRESGLAAYKELKNLAPDRNYNLVLLDRKLEDVENIKQSLLETIYPKTTHMDFNIAGALRLGVSGTKSKIIFTGLGADEIFSGYSRYRIAHKRAGVEELEREMIFDMERLWIRNLGRDDRSIGGMGKEVRYPFLYMPLWTYLRTLPIHTITEGTGEKKLLRKIAEDFGLELSSKFKKRAIQFGTRLAKLSNVKCFGSNRKAKGTHEYQ